MQFALCSHAFLKNSYVFSLHQLIHLIVYKNIKVQLPKNE